MFGLMAGHVDVSTVGPWLGLVSQNQGPQVCEEQRVDASKQNVLP